MDLLTWIFLLGGAALLLSEIFVPGMVAVFLGVAAILVAGLQWLGFIDGITLSVITWMGLSTGLTIGLRGWMLKKFPPHVTRQLPDENMQSIGAEVEVLETIHEDDQTGRIRYQGTTWPAQSLRGDIQKGQKARLMARQNLAWLVEPVGPSLLEGD